MTGVTNTLAADAVILASALNTNFADVVSLATAVGVEQLTGGITKDKMSDGYCPSFMSVELVPFATGTDWSGALGLFTLPATPVAMKRVRPILRAGEEGYLVGVSVNAVESVVDSGEYPLVEVYLNGTVKVASMTVSLDFGDNETFVQYKNDPIANPLVPLSDGDFLEFRVGSSGGTQTPTVRGLTAYLTFKHNLVA